MSNEQGEWCLIALLYETYGVMRVELKEFDNALMVLSHEIRNCRAMTQKVTGSYPDYIREQSSALEKSMAHADLIVSQLSSMLKEQQQSLFKSYMSVNDKNV